MQRNYNLVSRQLKHTKIHTIANYIYMQKYVQYHFVKLLA